MPILSLAESGVASQYPQTPIQSRGVIGKDSDGAEPAGIFPHAARDLSAAYHLDANLLAELSVLPR